MRPCRRAVLWHAILIIAIAANASAQRSEDQDEVLGEGVFIDFGLEWAAVLGNDVHVGDRTTVSGDIWWVIPSQFVDSSLERLVTRMDQHAQPRVRLGFRGDRWGVESELWRSSTSGELDGSFAPNDSFQFFEGRFAQSSEIVSFWNRWRRRSRVDEVQYRARNELSLLSARIDVTRNLARGVALAVGAHVAKLENERAEEIDFATRFTPPFDLLDGEMIETESGRAALDGWLIGPSAGIRGSIRWGQSARVGYSFAQSILFSSESHDSKWSRSTRSVPPLSFADDESLNSTLDASVAVPVSDFRMSVSFDVGEHVSIGVLGLLSVWYEAPTAVEYVDYDDFDEDLGGRWTVVERTLVFASVGPVVKIRF